MRKFQCDKKAYSTVGCMWTLYNRFITSLGHQNEVSYTTQLRSWCIYIIHNSASLRLCIIPYSTFSNVITLYVTVTNQYSFHEVLTITKPLTAYNPWDCDGEKWWMLVVKKYLAHISCRLHRYQTIARCSWRSWNRRSSYERSETWWSGTCKGWSLTSKL